MGHSAPYLGLRFFAIGAILLFSGGCIILPIPHPASSVRSRPGIVRPEDAAFIQPGVTTREQVLLCLGQPDDHWRDQQVFYYHWSTSTLGLFVAFDRWSEYIECEKHHALFIEFDSNSHVTRSELKQGDDAVRLKELWPTLPAEVK